MEYMTEHTQLIDAVNIRTAVRTYDDEPIDDDTARQLEMALQPINLLGDPTFSWCATSQRYSRPTPQAI